MDSDAVIIIIMTIIIDRADAVVMVAVMDILRRPIIAQGFVRRDDVTRPGVCLRGVSMLKKKSFLDRASNKHSHSPPTTKSTVSQDCNNKKYYFVSPKIIKHECRHDDGYG
jgi:hypothetical protein